MRRWYLIYTKPRGESVAEENLNRQGFHTYLPWLAKPSARRHARTANVEPLFPRYLFVEVDTEEQSVAPIRSTFGVSRIVTFGGRLTPVSGDLIETIKQNLGADGINHLPAMELQEGDRVRILSGSFEGLDGIFQATSGHNRVLILLDILGKTATVSIGRDQLASAGLTS